MILRFGKKRPENDYQLQKCTFKPQTNLAPQFIRRPSSAVDSRVSNKYNQQLKNTGGIMDKILKNSTTAKGMNFDLNGIQSPAKAAVSAVAEPKVSSKPVFTSAYLKKTINDENIPPN